jgi:DNA invertase Pin-like site-specific DNA recombinase
MTSAVGYCRVSTDQQGESGHGLAAQKTAIHAECQRRGWEFATMYADIGSGGSTKGRSDLARCLEVLDAGEADVLVVAKLDRLARSTLDFAQLVQRARDNRWALDAIDIGVDTSTPNGSLVANIIMALAEWEREIIGGRTRDALAAARQRGVQLGRPARLPKGTADTIVLLRSEGRSYHDICKTLNANGVPTAHGGAKWWPSSARSVFERATR